MRLPEITNVASVPEELRSQWRFDPTFRPGREVLMCFSAKNGHSYLIAGRHELHGHLLFRAVRLREFGPRTVEPLLIIRFMGLTDTEIARLERTVASLEGVHETSCLVLLLRALDEGLGIRIPERPWHLLWLVDHVRLFLTNGFVRRDGSVQPVRFYLNRDWTMDRVFDHFGRLDRRFRYLGLLSKYAGGPLLWMVRPFTALAGRITPLGKARI